jgi:hypothetical protein
MKKVAILQSNYIPWKGYFDLIAAVDEFIIYDNVQFTKNDWRNRNKIKTQKGVEWLSVPVGQDISRLIQDVEIKDNRWQSKHWESIQHAYKRAPYFDQFASKLKPLYLERDYLKLSELNRIMINFVCAELGIQTRISNSWDYEFIPGKSDRLVSICEQAGASEYISGPSAKNYLDEKLFTKASIKVTWFGYEDYPEYSQLWGEFNHAVSVIDLLFNMGSNSSKYMKHVK